MQLSEQLRWEQECMERGADRYFANQDRLREQGEGDTTDVMSHIIRERLIDAADFMRYDVRARPIGIGAKFNKIVRMVAQDDYPRIAYLGLKSILKAIQLKDKNTVLKVTLDIANRIEVDLKCQLFEAHNPAYYDTVRRSFASQNVTDYVHKHKVMMKKFNDFDLTWKHWSPSDKVHIGSRILKSLLNTFGDIIFMYRFFDKGKTIYKLDTTVQFDEWAAEFERVSGLLYPMYLPLKIKPRDWLNNTDGGYYSVGMKLRFIKSRGKEHKQFVEANPPKQHMQAVNKLQRTAWQINDDVLKVQEEIYQKGLGIGIPSNEIISPPPFPDHLKDIAREDLTKSQKDEVVEWKRVAKSAYGREQQRKGRVLAFMQSHKMAKELRAWDEFYFVYNCDFRGRIYCATAGLSPQGADPAKGLLRFATEVRLGKSGIKWLAIQMANTYGVDKVSYDDRVKWIRGMEANIRYTIEDPIGARAWWGAADKPYQFLAACFEWGKCNYGKNEDAVGQIPVGLDGSCNGLQHYSAMLRDSVGAKATNLLDSDVPQDIYQEVANVVISKLNDMDHPLASKWLSVGITRKCAKRPVMTLPYGATQTSARTYIMEYVGDNWAKFNMDDRMQWECAKFLTPILWESIGEVVIAARGAMTWLRQHVGTGFCSWLTPLGFPVYQYYKQVDATIVKTQLDGRLMLWLRDVDKDGEPKKSHQRNGIAPNFVHSIDSTHMVLTINQTELDAYAMIHDDYGTHAGNTEQLYQAIPKSFLYLYTNHNPLVDWAEQQGIDVETIPESGDYDINDIITAKYFFG